jgi:hypothetical protein
MGDAPHLQVVVQIEVSCLDRTQSSPPASHGGWLAFARQNFQLGIDIMIGWS